MNGFAITDDLRTLPVQNVVLDGEVVVRGSNGISDLHLLQADILRRRTDRLEYGVFDVLCLDGCPIVAFVQQQRPPAHPLQLVSVPACPAIWP